MKVGKGHRQFKKEGIQSIPEKNVNCIRTQGIKSKILNTIVTCHIDMY